MPLCPSSLFFLMPHRPPSSTLFPYTTLFRSNFEHADVPRLLAHFEDHERMCQALLAARLPLPAYEQVLKASHTFNLLDARRAISVTERQRYILRVRTLASAVARAYLESREARGFPLLKAATPVRAAAAGGAPAAAA